MNYIWSNKSPARKKRVHIQAYSHSGEELRSPRGAFAALCGIDMPFDRAINAPFALGRKICKHCERKLP